MTEGGISSSRCQAQWKKIITDLKWIVCFYHYLLGTCIALGHFDAFDSMMSWNWALRTWLRIFGRLPLETAAKAKTTAILIRLFM